MSTKTLPTIEGVFASLREFGLNFNEQEILDSCFEYACRIADFEAVNTYNPKNKGFLKYVIQQNLSHLLDLARAQFEKLGTLESLGYLVPSEQEISRALEEYSKNPENDFYKDFITLRSKEKDKRNHVIPSTP